MINPGTLQHHRTLAGHSQRSLAKTVGLSPLGIKRIEDGADASRLPLAIVRRIAQALGLTIDELLAPPELPPAAREQSLPDPGPLTYQQARLLRRIHRSDDIRRSLNKTDRELTLPALVRFGAVKVDPYARLTIEVAASLERPKSDVPQIPVPPRANVSADRNRRVVQASPTGPPRP